MGQDAFVDTSSAAYVIGGFTGGALAVGITLGAGSTLLAGRAGLSGLIGLSSGTSALQMTAQVYAVTQSIYGISLAGLKTYNWANNSNVLGVGSLTTWDALLFAPAVGAAGRNLSKLGSNLFKAGAPLQKTSLVASKADDAAGVAKQASRSGFDFVEETGWLGGRLYDPGKLDKLGNYLARRGVTLKVGDKYVPPGMGGGFLAKSNGTAELILRSNPTKYEVWHELSHFRHWSNIGADAYRGLPRWSRTNPIQDIPEQYVFDLLENGRHWQLLNDVQRQHAVEYIFSRGGIR